MALKGIYTVAIPNMGDVSKMSYVRVGSITSGKLHGTMLVNYLSEDKTATLGNAAFPFHPSVDSDAKNFIAQAYDQLKALPEFAGFVDC